LIEKQKDSKKDKSSHFLGGETNRINAEYQLDDLESDEFNIDRNEEDDGEQVSNFMFTSTKAIHETFNTQ